VYYYALGNKISSSGSNWIDLANTLHGMDDKVLPKVMTTSYGFGETGLSSSFTQYGHCVQQPWTITDSAYSETFAMHTRLSGLAASRSCTWGVCFLVCGSSLTVMTAGSRRVILGLALIRTARSSTPVSREHALTCVLLSIPHMWDV
jgi:hypothetical protein